jgi:hypothetical protein
MTNAGCHVHLSMAAPLAVEGHMTSHQTSARAMVVVSAILFVLAGGSCKSSGGDAPGTGGQSGGAVTSPDAGGGSGGLAGGDGPQPDESGTGAVAADVPMAADAVGGAMACPQADPGGMTCEQEDKVCSTTGPAGRVLCTCRLNGFGLMLWACEADVDAGP